MEFGSVIETIGKAIDALGVGILALGSLLALGGYALAAVRRRAGPDAYRETRQRLGRSILLGLELLVAADIIRTVAISPTFTSVGVLAIIVFIRTFLSMALEVELTGTWPWRKGREAATGGTTGTGEEAV